MSTKRCSKCGVTKPYGEFNRSRRDGLQSWCRPCQVSEVGKWKKANPTKQSGYKRKQRYGITPQQFLDIVEAQGGKCPICRRALAVLGEEPHVDHDHAFGMIRGILCRRCNLLVGAIEKNRTILPTALDYILESDRPEIGGAA